MQHSLTRAFQLKAVDDEAGTFEGYGSVFDVVDSDKDRVKRGAFARTLAERGAAGVKLLWQHDRTQPIGVYESITEDEHGLHVRGRLLVNEVQKAREAFALMKAGALDGLSIGYRTRTFRKDEKAGITDLLDLDLQEISPVTFPANGAARITGVKGDDMADKQEVELVEKAQLIESQQKAATLEKQLAAAQPLLAQIAELTGKAGIDEQQVELAQLAAKAARAAELEDKLGDERSLLMQKARDKKIPPVAMRGWQHLSLPSLREVVEKAEGLQAKQPGKPAESSEAPAAQASEPVLTKATKEQYRRCGITDEAQMLAAEKSRLAGGTQQSESDEDEE